MSAAVDVDAVTQHAQQCSPSQVHGELLEQTPSLPAPEILIQDWKGPLVRKQGGRKGGRVGPGWALGTWSTAGAAEHLANMEKSLLLPRGPRV